VRLGDPRQGDDVALVKVDLRQDFRPVGDVLPRVDFRPFGPYDRLDRVFFGLFRRLRLRLFGALGFFGLVRLGLAAVLHVRPQLVLQELRVVLDLGDSLRPPHHFRVVHVVGDGKLCDVVAGIVRIVLVVGLPHPRRLSRLGHHLLLYLFFVLHLGVLQLVIFELFLRLEGVVALLAGERQIGQVSRDVFLHLDDVVEFRVADDALQVDHRVDGAVVDQRVLASEGHAADVALVLADRGQEGLRLVGGVVAAHVPRQVMAQKEGAAAHLARVGSQAGVGGHVARQLDGRCEAGLAVVALVGLDVAVGLLVALQSLTHQTLSERCPFAKEDLSKIVTFYLFEDEALLADIAHEGSLLLVLGGVRVQIFAGQERAVALRTQVLRYVDVNLLVSVEQRLSRKRLLTHHTREGLAPRVGQHVFAQVVLSEKRFAALVAVVVALSGVIGFVKVQQLLQGEGPFAVGARVAVGLHLVHFQRGVQHRLFFQIHEIFVVHSLVALFGALVVFVNWGVRLFVQNCFFFAVALTQIVGIVERDHFGSFVLDFF
jgi:hypothetical protein